jgi:hypothetical protein
VSAAVQDTLNLPAAAASVCRRVCWCSVAEGKHFRPREGKHHLRRPSQGTAMEHRRKRAGAAGIRCWKPEDTPGSLERDMARDCSLVCLGMGMEHSHCEMGDMDILRLAQADMEFPEKHSDLDRLEMDAPAMAGMVVLWTEGCMAGEHSPSACLEGTEDATFPRQLFRLTRVSNC